MEQSIELCVTARSGFPASMETWRDVGGWQVGRHPEVTRRARRDGVWPDRTIADLAEGWLARDPGRILTIEGRHVLNVENLWNQASRLARRLQREGIAPGDVISFQLPNWWETAVINLAAVMIGAVVNPIVLINRHAELTHMLGSARSRMIFIPDYYRGLDYAAMLRSVVSTLPDPPTIVLVRGAAGELASFEELLGGPPIDLRREVNADAVKLLMYTSGTTGRPKAVLHSHNSIHADGIYMQKAMSLDGHDVVFCPSPLTHVSGYLWLLNMPWLLGFRAVSLDRWDAAAGHELLRRWQCSVMVGATPFLQDLVALIEGGGAATPALRHYICGGAAVPPNLIYRAAKALPNCLPWRTFGSTETTTLTRGPESRSAIRFGAETDGQLWSADARIVDIASGAQLPAGQEGELLVRGPGLMLGYAEAADNGAAFDDSGFFRMGDLVRRSDEGHLICTGRVKDLIIRAGENISAKEIEDLLVASPLIVEAAVVAKPSERTGEAACAFLVVRSGCIVTLADMIEMFDAAGVARHKTPEHLIIVDALPKTPAGKVRKDILRRLAIDPGAH